MEPFKKLKRNFCVNKGPYYNHFVHLFTLSIIWLVSAGADLFRHHNISIFILFIGISLYRPLFNVIRKVMNLCSISQDDPLNMIVTCMTLGVPFGIIFCFLPFINNTNIFFPSFGIILGVIFGMASYVYKLKNYAFLSLALIGGCLYIAFQFETFAMGGYYVAACLAVFSFLNRIIGEVKFNFAKKAAKGPKLEEAIRA